MPRVRLENGLNFYYQQAGQGPDVVLIHGVTGNMAIWPLIDLIRNLSQSFRVTYYDLRGHGYSDTTPSGYTSADMVADLAQLQRALGLGPMYVMGHSFGGVVAMHAAVLLPDQVRGVILSDPCFPALRHLETGVPHWDGWQDFKRQCADAGLEISDNAWYDVGEVLRQAASLTPERKVMFEKVMGGPALQRLVRLAATTCGQDVQEVAGLTEEKILSVRQPVLALYGEHSPFLTTCRHLETHLASCRVALVPGAKHLGHEENPAGYVDIVCRNLRAMAGIDGVWEPTGRSRREAKNGAAAVAGRCGVAE
jgi:pimeloyl-ACP methyl ester carboxylesterase